MSFLNASSFPGLRKSFQVRPGKISEITCFVFCPYNITNNDWIEPGYLILITRWKSNEKRIFKRRWRFAQFGTICTICTLKLKISACNFTKSNTPPWVFFTFFKLYKLYQFAQSVTYIKQPGIWRLTHFSPVLHFIWKPII